MANNLGEMVVSIVGENAQFDSAIDKSESKLTSFSNKALKLGVGLSAAVTLPLVAMGKAAIQSSAQMEMLQASFTTMLGSATKAALLMQELKDLAAVTPFETTDLADASKTLLQFGVSSEKLLPTLKVLGDIAQGNGQKFNSLALVFGQMSSAGKLMGQDLLQMINAGFNPLKVISEQTGESMSSLKDKMSKGAISADMVTEAFKSATSQGGLFYKGMETASKTFDGLVSTLQDDVATMGRAFVEDLMPILKDVVKGLSSAAQWVTGLDSTTKTIILTMGGFAAAAGPVLLAVGGISKAILGLRAAALAAGTSIGAIMGPAGLVIGALAVLATGIALFASKAKKAKEDTENLNAAINRTASLEAMQVELTKTTEKIDKLKEAQKKLQETNTTFMHGAEKVELDEKNKLLEEQISNLEAQRNYIRKNMTMTQIQNELDRKATEYLEERNVVVDEYNKKLSLIKLEQEQGSITEKQANDRRKSAIEDYIADLNQVIVKYKLVPGETSKMVDAAIKELAKLKIATKDAWVVDREEVLSDYKEKIALVALEVKQRIKTEEEAKEARKKATEDYIDDLNKIIVQYKLIPGETTKMVDSAIIELKRLSVEKTYALSPIDPEIEAGLEEYSVWLEKFKQQREEEKAIAAAIPAQSPIDPEKEFEALEEYSIWLEKFKKQRKEEQEEIDNTKDKQDELNKFIKSSIVETASETKNIIDSIYENQLDALESYTNKLLKANEEQLQAALELAGVADDTAVESAQKKLDAAIEANDLEAISEAEKALKKAQIEEDFAKKEEAIRKEAAIKEHAIKVKQFKADQAFQIAQVGMDVASGIVKIWSQAGINVVLGGILTAVLAGIGIAKVAAISGQQPPELALADGGIIPATPGGVNATLAEGGQTEVVFPLDRLEEFINKGPTNNESMGNINLKVYLDSKPFLDTIFPATKNKTVLISSKAVVS